MDLIDTMVLSELRLCQRGIARKRSSDAAFASQLAEWLDQLLRLHGDRLRSATRAPTC